MANNLFLLFQDLDDDDYSDDMPLPDLEEQ